MGACLKDHSPRLLKPVRPGQVGGEAAEKWWSGRGFRHTAREKIRQNTQLATLKQALQNHQGAIKVTPHFFLSLVGGEKIGNKLWSRKIKSNSTVRMEERINLHLDIFYNFVTNFSFLMGLETNGGRFSKKEANGQQVRIILSTSTNWKIKRHSNAKKRHR